jgi:signal transduction histidine kinase
VEQRPGKDRLRALRALVVIGPPAIIAVFAAVILLVGREALASRRLVAHTRDVLAAAQLTLSHLQDAETGQRGFLLTGDTAYLAPYHAATNAIRTDTSRLRALTRDNAVQQRRLDELGPAIAAKLVELDSTIRIARSTGRGAAVEHVRTGRGKRLMDDVRLHIARLQAEEERLLTLRQAGEVRSVRRGTLVVLVGALVAAALAWTTSRLLAGQARALTVTNVRLARNADALAASEREVRQLAAGLEREVEARTRELRTVNRELEAFTYTVSHDLRAPLRALQGFAAALDEDYVDRLDETGREYTAFIANAARQMDQLIQDLLAFSRIGRSEVRVAPLDLRDAVREAHAQVEADLTAAGAELSIMGALTLEAPPDGAAVVLGDRRLAVQAIANLLTNAAKFVAPGTRPRIGVFAEGRGDRLRLVVEDNGIGVAPEHRERVFNVFERLHSSEEYAGTGVGLAIVRRAAERMGGAAGLEPAPAGGTRAWMEWRVPGTPADAAAVAAAALPAEHRFA